MATAAPSGRCIFCDQPGLTKEHLWPDWLKRFLPRKATDHFHTTGSSTIVGDRVNALCCAQPAVPGQRQCHRPRPYVEVGCKRHYCARCGLRSLHGLGAGKSAADALPAASFSFGLIRILKSAVLKKCFSIPGVSPSGANSGADFHDVDMPTRIPITTPTPTAAARSNCSPPAATVVWRRS